MNDTTDVSALLSQSATRMFSDMCTQEAVQSAENGVWPQALWDAAEQTGLVDAAREELGLDLLAVVARAVGSHAVPLPLVEGYLAHRMLARAGLVAPSGRTTLACGLSQSALQLSRAGEGFQVSGVLTEVPWGRNADAVAAIARDPASGELHAVLLQGIKPTRIGQSLAGEPRDDFTLDALRVDPAGVAPWPAQLDPQTPFLEGALLRSVQMVGALEKVLDLTVRYATERVQFGRAIGKFQAIQHQIAELVGHVAAASAASEAALLACGEGVARFPIAAAKARVSEAAGAACAIAHQVHGAMGFTHEHMLQLSTRRLLSWRDEFGSEIEWARWIGQVLQQFEGDGLWPFLLSNGAQPAHAATTEIRFGPC